MSGIIILRLFFVVGRWKSIFTDSKRALGTSILNPGDSIEEEEEEIETPRSGPPFSLKEILIGILQIAGPVMIITMGSKFTCPFIPSLKCYVCIDGILRLTSNVLKIWFRIPDDPSQKQNNISTRLADFSGVLQLLISVWGAVITFGRVADHGGDKCDKPLFFAGFMTAVLTLSVLGFILVSVVYMMGLNLIKRKRGDELENVENDISSNLLEESSMM